MTIASRRCFVLAGSLLLGLGVGCGGGEEKGPTGPANRFPGVTLTVVVPEGPLAAAIENRLGDWEGETAGKVILQAMPLAEMETALTDPGGLKADVVVYPVAWTGRVGAAVGFAALPKRFKSIDYSDLLPAYRRLTRWGEEIVAVPLAGDCLLCYYRRDWFTDSKHTDAYLAKTGRRLAPPQTWEDYLDIAAYFREVFRSAEVPARLPEPSGGQVYGLVEPWGDLSRRRQCWQARVAAYAKDGDNYTLLVDLDNLRPQMARAGFDAGGGTAWQADAGFRLGTEGMRRAADYGPPNMPAVSEADARKLFLRGGAALCLAGADLPLWAVKDKVWGEPEERETLLSAIGVCMLPGSRQRVDRRTGKLQPVITTNRATIIAVGTMLASITKQCGKPEAGTHLLAFLCGKEIGLEHATDVDMRLGVYRRSHFSEPGAWAGLAGMGSDLADRYLAVLSKTMAHDNVVLPLRGPSAPLYVAPVDAMLEKALTDRSPIDGLLTELARQFEAVTDRLGREAQRRHLRQSLGLREAAPTPLP